MDNLIELIRYEPHAVQVLDCSPMECSNNVVDGSTPSIMPLQNVAMSDIFVNEKPDESEKVVISDDSIPLTSYYSFVRNLQRFQNDSFENAKNSTIRAADELEICASSVKNERECMTGFTYNTWTMMEGDIAINTLPTYTPFEETETTSYLGLPECNGTKSMDIHEYVGTKGVDIPAFIDTKSIDIPAYIGTESVVIPEYNGTKSMNTPEYIGIKCADIKLLLKKKILARSEAEDAAELASSMDMTQQ